MPTSQPHIPSSRKRNRETPPSSPPSARRAQGDPTSSNLLPPLVPSGRLLRMNMMTANARNELHFRPGLSALRQYRNAVAPRPPRGSRTDHDFHLAFIETGQGDCTVMATPRGKIIMIDCGSMRKPAYVNTEIKNNAFIPVGVYRTDYLNRVDSGLSNLTGSEYVRSVLNTNRFLAGYDRIDLMILTHGHDDHYNLLGCWQPLPQPVKLDVIKKLFYSGRRKHYRRKTYWGMPGRDVIRELENLPGGTSNVIPVTHARYADGRVISRFSDVNLPSGSGLNEVDANRGILIHQETDPARPNDKTPVLSVRILAAGVGKGVSYRADPNSGSIVTLIEIFGKKILITGDATKHTEGFILNHHAAAVQNIDIAHIPHHGSNQECSTRTWVEAVNARTAVANAGMNLGFHYLPQDEALRRYENHGSIMEANNLTKINLVTGQHKIWSWPASASSRSSGRRRRLLSKRTIEKAVYTTGSNGTQYFSIKKNRTQDSVRMEYGAQ